MFTHKDIEHRSIFVINGLEHRALTVSQGMLHLEDTENKKTLTKMPFQKILAIFVIGHTTVTTALIDKCKLYGVSIVVMKPNFRVVFFYAYTAEANFLLRKKQYEYDKTDISIGKILIGNKIENQIMLLNHTRLKNPAVNEAKRVCTESLSQINHVSSISELMGVEGAAARAFFAAYYSANGWNIRSPRTRIDPINAVLDIGYTILFNYMEAFTRLFGFDLYIGVYHQLWFKRKSLICDLVEPFRCLIDKAVRKGFNLGQLSVADFDIYKDEYILKREKRGEYMKLFFDVLIDYKTECFIYVRDYYRYFMNRQSVSSMPSFKLK